MEVDQSTPSVANSELLSSLLRVTLLSTHCSPTLVQLMQWTFLPSYSKNILPPSILSSIIVSLPSIYFWPRGWKSRGTILIIPFHYVCSTIVLSSIVTSTYNITPSFVFVHRILYNVRFDSFFLRYLILSPFIISSSILIRSLHLNSSIDLLESAWIFPFVYHFLWRIRL